MIGDYDVTEARNGSEAINQIRKHPPDVVFLDIKMPGMSGFDVLHHFPDRNFHVVFQTAFDQYALRAFDENAIDYLLKPFNLERLQQCLQKLENKSIASMDQSPEVLSSLGWDLKRMTVQVGDGYKVIDVRDILFIRSEDRIVFVYLESNRYAIGLSLNEIEEKVSPDNFKRVHRSSIVNLSKVKSLKIETSRTSLIMKNGEKVEVSRNYRKTMKQIFSEDVK